MSSDEEIFAEKTKEIESLKENVRELEEEKAKLGNQLQETQLRLKKHEDQLFHQQLQLNQLLLNQGISQGTVIHSSVCWLVSRTWLVSWFRSFARSFHTFHSFRSLRSFVSFVFLFVSFVLLVRSFVSFVLLVRCFFFCSFRSFHSFVRSFVSFVSFVSLFSFFRLFFVCL